MKVGKPFKQITRAANKVDYRNLGEIASTFRHVSSVNGEIAYGQYNYFREDVNNIWVDNGGDDRLNGSFRQPKRSIEAAVDLAQSGDIVNVLPGDYYPNSHIELKEGVVLNFYPSSRVFFDYKINPYSGWLFWTNNIVDDSDIRVLGQGEFYIEQSGVYNGALFSRGNGQRFEFECRILDIKNDYGESLSTNLPFVIQGGYANLKIDNFFGVFGTENPDYMFWFPDVSETNINIKNYSSSLASNLAGPSIDFLFTDGSNFVNVENCELFDESNFIQSVGAGELRVNLGTYTQYPSILEEETVSILSVGSDQLLVSARDVFVGNSGQFLRATIEGESVIDIGEMHSNLWVTTRSSSSCAISVKNLIYETSYGVRVTTSELAEYLKIEDTHITCKTPINTDTTGIYFENDSYNYGPSSYGKNFLSNVSQTHSFTIYPDKIKSVGSKYQTNSNIYIQNCSFYSGVECLYNGTFLDTKNNVFMLNTDTQFTP